MGAIAAHFRYISKSGRLPFEDDRGVAREGREALGELAEQWRVGGSYIEDTGHRREAFNLMLSMPSGTDPLALQRAAREFAHAELADHRWVMVLHDHQSNPHVHLSVRAESRHGKRLNPRKADLQRWREVFAEKLRGWGVEAEATRQATRGQVRNFDALWRLKAGEDGRLRTSRPDAKTGAATERSRKDALVAWAHIARGLASSQVSADRALAASIDRYVQETPFAQAYAHRRERALDSVKLSVEREPSKTAQTRQPQPETRRPPQCGVSTLLNEGGRRCLCRRGARQRDEEGQHDRQRHRGCRGRSMREPSIPGIFSGLANGRVKLARELAQRRGVLTPTEN